MSKSEDTVKEEEAWGTWEELLLACAVNRHGTNNWDSVAIEIQNRSSSSFLHLLTPQNCKHKYFDLKRRFMSNNDDDKSVVGDDDDESDEQPDDKIPWLEDLRQLRVAELRREVQRYDVSIVSLQLKVERLKEEREQSSREKENDEQKPDLEKERVKEETPEKSSPEKVAGASIPGEESDRENQSFNESNSTDPKAKKREDGVEETEKKTVAVEPVVGRLDPVSGESKPFGEGSYHGSTETIAKESAAQPIRKSQRPVESTELWESMAESKEEGRKENSDVQSSASLSRKNRPKKAISGSSSGEEPETDEVSPAIKSVSVKSQPLITFLEIIRSHKYGSFFERRLESQETTKYRNLIRKHVDLETVRTRLEEGVYSGCSRKFFRDLLLLFTNATVFFPNNSTESLAAVALRRVVSKELAIRARNPGPPKEEEEEEDAAPAAPPVLPPAEQAEPPDTELAKPKSSGPIIACRKRSSISSKPSSSSAVIDKKGEERASAGADEKPVPDRKQPVSFPNVVDEQSLRRTRERSSLGGARSSRTGSKSNRTNTNKNPSGCGSGQNHTLGPNFGSAGKGSAHDEEPKTERMSNTTTTTTTGAVAKKRSAANFLNRMKRNSSSNGTLLETLKNSVKNSNNGKGSGGGGGGELGAEQKRGGGKSDARKDHGGRQSSSGKQAAEQSSPAKRSVGRPPKRAAAPPPLPPPAPSKRTRETADTAAAAAAASRKSRKRPRR